MAHTYNYSIIQLIPDVRRGETINIGLVVYLPNKVDVRIFPTLSKIRAINAQIDIQQLYDLPNDINSWLEGVTDIEERYSALKNFGFISVSKPGWFTLEQPDEYDRYIEKLVVEFIKPRARIYRRVDNRTKLSVSIRNTLKKQRILGADVEDINKHLVVQKFPIDPSENLFADFALKNGVYRITETVDFRSESKGDTDKNRDAAFAAITLDKATKILGTDTIKYVIYAASAKTEKTIEPQLNLLSDYASKVLNYLSQDDYAFYINELMSAATQSLEFRGE